MKFPDKVYDALKWICLIFLPALGVLLATILPAVGVDEALVKLIVIVLGAVETFIGTLIGVSTVAHRAEVAAKEIKVGGTD